MMHTFKSVSGQIIVLEKISFVSEMKRTMKEKRRLNRQFYDILHYVEIVVEGVVVQMELGNNHSDNITPSDLLKICLERLEMFQMQIEYFISQKNAVRVSGQIESIMKDRKCTYTYTVEEQGNKNKKENVKGIVRSEIIQKVTDKGTYSMIWVENEESGQLHEVFANSVTLIK